MKLLLLLHLVFIGTAFGQTPSPRSTDPTTAALDSVKPSGSTMEQELKQYGISRFECEKEQSDEAKASCMGARKAYYEYATGGLQRRLGVYAWNNFSTKVIFCMVLMIVFSGLYFSWIHFRGSVVRLRQGEAAEVQETEVELAVQGIKVRSPVLGVVILAVSLVFFYLYLVHVYPVKESF